MYRKNRTCCDIPNEVYLAYSGGSDSSAILNFLLKGKRKVHLLHFNHGTSNAYYFENYCLNKAKEYDLQISIGYADLIPLGRSKEDWWRESRYNFFNNFNKFPIVLGHHLEDQIETYIFGMIHGKQKTMKCCVGNIIRPFLCFEKEKLISLSVDGEHLIDPSNSDISFPRNRIRHTIAPQIKHINPGIGKTIIKLMNEETNCGKN
jgi:tRNA(Ile)-lysidine synthase